jgi:hypothetical protein
VTSVRRADLTGDGRTESIVAAACRSTTAPNPVRVFVHDGAGRRAPGKLLLTIGTNQYLTSAELTITGRTVRVVSRALSDRAPRCCPDLRITQSYTWTGTDFRPSGMKQAGL